MPRVIFVFILLASVASARAGDVPVSFERRLSDIRLEVLNGNDPSRFRWRWYIDPPRSVCVNGYGEHGLNDASLEELLKTSDGECADWRGKDLGGINLPAVNFQGALLAASDLSGANIRKARLRGADLAGALFRGADMRVADISKLDMKKADLSGADLSGALFFRTDMRDCDLTGANFQGARFSRADLRGAKTEGARFLYAEYDSATRLPFSPEHAARLGMIKTD